MAGHEINRPQDVVPSSTEGSDRQRSNVTQWQARKAHSGRNEGPSEAGLQLLDDNMRRMNDARTPTQGDQVKTPTQNRPGDTDMFGM